MKITSYKSILLLTGLSMLATLVACGGSSNNSGGGGGTTTTTPTKLAATSGGGQSATVGTAFANPLVATVTDASGNPVSGVAVTFTAPASGATGTFATTPAAATDTETTASNGQATSQIFTANSTPGGPYNVVASSGTLTPVNFAETNTAAAVASNTYVFYASGEDSFGSVLNYYAIAGAVTIDANGNILGGEQDYNDAFGLTAADQISAANTALVMDSSGNGLYTLTITTTDTNLGGVNTAAGVEEFAVQFVNSNHALITQFDGSATSSGSLDLQTATTTSGNFAFALSGVDLNYNSVAFGGVYTASGGTLNGTLDINDNGTVIPGTTFTANSSTPDTYGRSTVTGITNPVTTTPITFAAYVLGPEAVRIIDIDNSTDAGYDSAVGSAFGQGSATFSNASLTNDLFTLLGQWSENYATLGGFGTDSNGTITGGEADDNELDNSLQQVTTAITGSYSIASNGYGTISFVGDGDVTATNPAGLYMVDPTLNINDPNSSGSGQPDVGGALIVDMDPGLPGGIGVITPLTTGSFSGTYVAGFQNFNDFQCTASPCSVFEFDMISQGTMTTGAALSLTGDDSDPFGSWDGTGAESTADTFTSTPLNVSSAVYSMSTANSPANPLAATINAAPGNMDVDIYQASGTMLYWLEFDANGVFLGPIVAQRSLTGLPAVRKPDAKAQANQNKNTKLIQGLGGTLR